MAKQDVRNDPDGGIARYFRQQRSDRIVEAEGQIVRVLSDDNEGTRHQRWIVRVATGITVLVAHNLHRAGRVPVKRGDTIRFRGEYEWSELGGIVHWTHEDDDGNHAHGWIDHDGKRYD